MGMAISVLVEALLCGSEGVEGGGGKPPPKDESGGKNGSRTNLKP